MDVEAERLVGVPLLQEIYCMGRDSFGCIAFFREILSTGKVTLESRGIVFALAAEHVEPVKTLRLALHVPFADDGSLVAGIAQKLRNEGDGSVYSFSECTLAVLVAVESGHQAGAAGSRKGILDIGFVEPDPFTGKAVHVGRGSLAAERVAIGTEGLIGVVIRHDVDDVHPLGSIFLLCSGHRGKGRQDGQKEAVGNRVR